MKRNRTYFAYYLILTAMLSLAFVLTAHAQSADMDNPTPLYANVIEGEGDGKGETVYYYFTATKGDVKVTVDGKTNNYSTPLRVSLMDEDGKELLPIYVVANDVGKREVTTKRFVREQKVLVRVSTQDDRDVKLLTYKIKIDGTAKFETPPTPPAEPLPGQAPPPTEPPADGAAPQTAEGNSVPPAAPADPTLKDKIKKKVKETAKKKLNGILDN